jgi:LPXTG-motif cell wall-anchored protein
LPHKGAAAAATVAPGKAENMLLRRTLTLVGLTMVGVLLVAGPAWATYPPDGPSVGTPSSDVANGGSTTVSGSGWEPGSTVSLTVQSTPQSLGTTTVADDGTFTKDVVLPCLDAGTHTITASGTASDGTAKSSTTTITVSGSCTDPGGGTLPHTGSNVASLLTLTAGLCLVGAVLLIVANRRRASATRS